jgi:mannitol/fructose-specific phosphotransferase system IIA component
VSVIEELAARAYSNRWLADKPWFVGALVERESLASTAMEGGVAFLHTRARDKGKIVRPFVVVGRSYL